jgi:hypothetical protein
VQLARTGGWYDDDTYPMLLDMRQTGFIRKLQNRRKSLGSARIVLCRKDGAGKGTIPNERRRKGGTIPAKHAAKIEYLSLWRKSERFVGEFQTSPGSSDMARLGNYSFLTGRLGGGEPVSHLRSSDLACRDRPSRPVTLETDIHQESNSH